MEATLDSSITEREVEEAYSQFGPMVLLRCRRILCDEASAEDALQETFLRLWRWGSAFRQAESKLSWLYRVAERCCFDRLSKRKRLAETPLLAHHEQGRSTSDPIGDWDMIAVFLGKLDDRMRRVAIMHYLDDMTQEQIGVELGWTRQTVAKKLGVIAKRAAKLKTRLSGETV